MALEIRFLGAGIVAYSLITVLRAEFAFLARVIGISYF